MLRLARCVPFVPVVSCEVCISVYKRTCFDELGGAVEVARVLVKHNLANSGFIRLIALEPGAEPRTQCESLETQGFLATRNPTDFDVSPVMPASRAEVLVDPVSLSNEPPRMTRADPVWGPVGLVCAEGL